MVTGVETGGAAPVKRVRFAPTARLRTFSVHVDEPGEAFPDRVSEVGEVVMLCSGRRTMDEVSVVRMNSEVRCAGAATPRDLKATQAVAEQEFWGAILDGTARGASPMLNSVTEDSLRRASYNAMLWSQRESELSPDLSTEEEQVAEAYEPSPRDPEARRAVEKATRAVERHLRRRRNRALIREFKALRRLCFRREQVNLHELSLVELADQRASWDSVGNLVSEFRKDVNGLSGSSKRRRARKADFDTACGIFEQLVADKKEAVAAEVASRGGFLARLCGFFARLFGRLFDW